MHLYRPEFVCIFVLKIYIFHNIDVFGLFDDNLRRFRSDSANCFFRIDGFLIFCR